MAIDYDASLCSHTVIGAKTALARLFSDAIPASVLDVGCGPGAWMRAALDAGVPVVRGVDGGQIPHELLHVDPSAITSWDLTKPVTLDERFDLVLCLEVAEHLDAEYADVLIDSLTRHSDTILFSAARPGQHGQHHVNCRWLDYWQELFNRRGFACDDEFRWTIWLEQDIEIWYRQNIMIARRSPAAGAEPRILPVVHPGYLEIDRHIPAQWEQPHLATLMQRAINRVRAKIAPRPREQHFD